MSIDDKIVSLESVKRMNACADVLPSDTAPPEFIKPRSIVDMTDTEADAHLVALRERRLRSAQLIREQKEQKAQIASAVARQKIEKKIEQVERAEQKVGDALERLETVLFQLRALILQHE